MSRQTGSNPPGYDASYRDFDSPLMRQLRQEAYGEDIGQHSWVVAAELREDLARFRLSRSSRFLDLGCGPCGPLTFILKAVGCRGTGMDFSGSALEIGRARAAALGVEGLITVREADLDEPLPFGAESFDAVMALDVVLHLRDRAGLFRDVARVLSPGGKFLFTDAGVVTGPLADREIEARSMYGNTQFVAPGVNERVLEASGLRLLETEDRTASVLANATGRLAGLSAHRAELEKLKGAEAVERERHYLETVIDLSRRKAVSRVMYFAESQSRHSA